MNREHFLWIILVIGVLIAVAIAIKIYLHFRLKDIEGVEGISRKGKTK